MMWNDSGKYFVSCKKFVFKKRGVVILLFFVCFQDQIQDTHVWTWVAPGVYFYQPKYPDKEAGRE